MRLLGAHVSASGGVEKAVERAATIGCNCVQVFSGSPRVWARPSISKIDTKQIYSNQQKMGVKPIFTHALYLVNLASDNPELLAKSNTALRFDLAFDSLVKGAGVIVHLGSHQGRGWTAAREQVAEQIADILDHTPADSTFLIENSAGQQGKLCSDLPDIKWLMDVLQSPRLGWCFDTCHAFAAGYSLGSNVQAGRQSQTAIAAISELELWSTLKIIHVNDSRDPFGSGRDRHANLGDGEIPSEDLRFFLTQPEVSTVPLVLEVPGIDGEGPDAENVRRLQALVG